MPPPLGRHDRWPADERHAIAHPDLAAPPASGSPATSRSVVVLPQPEGPSRATSSPGRDLEVDRLVHRADVAEALGEAGDASMPGTVSPLRPLDAPPSTSRPSTALHHRHGDEGHHAA